MLALNGDDVTRVVVGDDVAVKAGHELGAKPEPTVQQPAAPGPTGTATPTMTTTPTPADTPTVTPTPTDTAVPPQQVLPHADGRIDGTAVRFEVLRLVLSGHMLILDARLLNRDDPKVETGALRIGTAFDDGVKDRSGGTDDSLDGIRILDSKADRVYGVAHDSHHVCVCSTRLSFVTVDPGQAAPLTATFNAPDNDPATVHILVPGFDRLPDVPVVK